MKKLVAYIRVSTSRQLDGQGPQQQQRDIMAWALTAVDCEGKPVMIDRWVIEDETGTKEDREEILKLKEQARAGELGTLVLTQMDRLGRDAAVSLSLYRDFTRLGVKVIFVHQDFDDNSSGRAMLGFNAVMAQWVKEDLIERMKKNKRIAVARHGTFAGGTMPYGYAPAGNGKLKLVPGETKLIVRTFELRDNGNTQSQIARILREEGFRTRKGTEFTPKQVARILDHEAQYRGDAVFGDRKLDDGVQAAHPAVLK